MCQFCGVDPAFAAYFEEPGNNSNTPTTEPAALASSQGVRAPNFFRLKPTNPRYKNGGNMTTQQLTTFASSLSANAKVIMGHHGQAYDEALQRWSKCAVKRALAVVKVASTEDVRKTILMAESHGLPFVVKCGGHSPSGKSSIDNGIVIDLSLMRDVSVKPDEKLVIAGGGALAEDVIKAASEYGLACVTGSTGHVGIGGLMLHGGYGYLTGEYGLAVDNIVGAEVVTAKGQIVWTDQEENKDLFWAIRGAGSMFGVITKLVLKAHPISPQIWGGVICFSGSQVKEVVEAANEWFSQKDDKAAAAIALGKVSDGKAGLVLMPFYDGTESEAQTNFAPFLRLANLSQDTGSMTYWKVNSLGDAPGGCTDDGIRFQSANIKPPLSVSHIQGALDRLDQLYENTPLADKTGCLILMVQPTAIEKYKRTDMAFAWRDNHFDVGVAVRFPSLDMEEQMAAWSEDFAKYLSTQGDTYRVYINHSDFTGPTSRAYGINYMKLLQLKDQWDPAGLFPKL